MPRKKLLRKASASIGLGSNQSGPSGASVTMKDGKVVGGATAGAVDPEKKLEIQEGMDSWRTYAERLVISHIRLIVELESETQMRDVLK